jgi:hypothetical protein
MPVRLYEVVDDDFNVAGLRIDPVDVVLFLLLRRLDALAGAPSRLGTGRLGQRLVGCDDVHRVDLTFPGIDAGERGAHHLDRGKLSGTRRSTGCRRRDHGEQSWRSNVSSSGLAGQYAGVSGHRVLRRRQVVQVAGGELPGLDRPQRRLLRPAAVEHIEAAGVKAAAAGRLARARQSPLRIIRWDLN